MRTSSTTSTSKVSKPSSREDSEYQELVQQLRSASGFPLFTTDATDLYATFLNVLPKGRRQYYECRACRKFVDKFGGLVVIDEGGFVLPLLWRSTLVGPFFQDAVHELHVRVVKAKVTGVFLSNEPIWGLAENASPKSPSSDGMWRHLHIKPSSSMIHRPSSLFTSEQVAAERLQDFGTLSRALAEFPVELVRKAHTLLTTGALYRSEKCIGVAKWLLDLHEARDATKHKTRRENLTWRAVAFAAPGFCHVRSTMIGALLTDLEAGKDFAEIKESFDSKLHPLQYQRPQVAPTDGQLAAAEAVISKLASAGSLRRRYAMLDEITPHAIWVPKDNSETNDRSVFGHLSSKKNSSSMDIPTQPMTWDKFSWTILPTAERVEFMVPLGAMPLFAFVTAADPDAPPILQWDSEAFRNPMSWYLYNNGSLAGWWNLKAGAFCDVTAITLQPSGWHEDRAHQGDGAYFVLKGARDLHATKAGLGLFPEILRAEYRSIRAAVEAYSRSKTLEGIEAASACGLVLGKGAGTWNAAFRVTAKGVRALYRLDRWD